jgi:hypothetical protein
MRNNTIKMHLALHIMEDFLDHGVPDVVKSSYAESAHNQFAKNISGTTQKRVAALTQQAAAHRYHKDLVILLAFSDVEVEAMPAISVTSSGAAGHRFILSQQPSAGGDIMLHGTLPVEQMMIQKADCHLVSPDLQ